jgi:hypothetical protein
MNAVGASIENARAQRNPHLGQFSRAISDRPRAPPVWSERLSRWQYRNRASPHRCSSAGLAGLLAERYGQKPSTKEASVEGIRSRAQYGQYPAVQDRDDKVEFIRVPGSDENAQLYEAG